MTRDEELNDFKFIQKLFVWVDRPSGKLEKLANESFSHSLRCFKNVAIQNLITFSWKQLVVEIANTARGSCLPYDNVR